ncbi:MAG: phasin family protein [Methylobacter sp.]|nr:phasin family protein [Methylobacter sp.]
MQKENFENINSFNQFIFNAYKEFFEINMRVGQKWMENQLKLSDLCMHHTIRQLELARDFKDTKTYIESQSEIAKQTADAALSINKEVLSITTDARNELKGLLNKGVEEFDKGVKEAQKNVHSESSKKAA